MTGTHLIECAAPPLPPHYHFVSIAAVDMLTKVFNDEEYKVILGQMNTSLNLLLEKI